MRVVIDTVAWAHAIRRWWWKMLRRRGSKTQCVDCGCELTIDEAYHYINTCERCEVISFHRWAE